MTVAARLVPKGLRISALWMIKRKLWDVLWSISARGSGGRIRTSPVYPWAIALSLFPLAWCEEYLSKALHTPSTSLGVLWVFFFPLTREDRPNEAIAAPLQRFTLPCYYCQVLSAQAKIGTIKNSFFFSLPSTGPSWHWAVGWFTSTRTPTAPWRRSSYLRSKLWTLMLTVIVSELP